MFIEQILSKEIIIERKKKSEIIERLVELKYPELSTNLDGKVSYDYITNLALFSLTSEKIQEFIDEYNNKLEELNMYKNTTIQNLWIKELDNLQKVYDKWLLSSEENNSKIEIKNKTNKSKIITSNTSKGISVKTK